MSFTLEKSAGRDFEAEELDQFPGYSFCWIRPSKAIMEEAANCLNGTSTVDVLRARMQKVNLVFI